MELYDNEYEGKLSGIKICFYDGDEKISHDILEFLRYISEMNASDSEKDKTKAIKVMQSAFEKARNAFARSDIHEFHRLMPDYQPFSVAGRDIYSDSDGDN